MSLPAATWAKWTGKGALGIWTHNLNAVEPLLNYSRAAYRDAALCMGAGVLTDAAYAAAHRVGHRVVGAVHRTIGIAGGYSLGGGHSPLTPLHGLSAANALEQRHARARLARPARRPVLGAQEQQQRQHVRRRRRGAHSAHARQKPRSPPPAPRCS